MTEDSTHSQQKFLDTLDSGRVIELTALHQSQPYSGFLCGYPNKHINDRYIEHVLGKCLKVFPFAGKPALIPPKIPSWPDHPAVKNPHGLGVPCVNFPW